MGKNITIPWLSGSQVAYISWVHRLKTDLGMNVKFIRYAGEDIKKFESQEYPLILMDLFSAPGGEYIDEKVKEIMGDSTGPDYNKVGLRVIERTRQADSCNKDTPLLVLDTCFNEELEKLCLEAGATEYLDPINVLPKELTEKVKTYLR